MNTFNYIQKEAAWDILKDVSGATIATYAKMLALAGATGLVGGHIAARATSPSVIKENSDKIITSEALATEIDVTERKLRDLEKRRASLEKRKQGTQAYDRFV